MSGPSIAELLAYALPDMVVRASAPSASTWLESGDDAPPFALRAVGGRTSLWHADRPAEIATDLDGAAPLFGKLEAVSGWRFEPRGLWAQTPSRSLTIEHDGTMLELALDPADPVPGRLLAAAASAPREATRPFPRLVRLSGPALPVGEATDLARGDLLLLPAATAAAIDGVDTPLRLDLAAGQLSAHRWPAPVPNGLSVTLTLELGPVLLSDAELQELANGGTLSVGPPGELGPVTLFVGGRPLGQGRLVRVGQAWAVAIDHTGAQAC